MIVFVPLSFQTGKYSTSTYEPRVFDSFFINICFESDICREFRIRLNSAVTHQYYFVISMLKTKLNIVVEGNISILIVQFGENCIHQLLFGITN